MNYRYAVSQSRDESAVLVQPNPYIMPRRSHSLSRSDIDYGFRAPVVKPMGVPKVSASVYIDFFVADVSQDVEREFDRLASIWRAETILFSRLDKRCMHRAYQRIIAMGEIAIPFILRDLKRTHDDWFWALNVIAGEDSIPDDTPDSVDSLVEAWLSWGRANGYNV
jgi:hypothetical protein